MPQPLLFLAVVAFLSTLGAPAFAAKCKSLENASSLDDLIKPSGLRDRSGDTPFGASLYSHKCDGAAVCIDFYGNPAEALQLQNISGGVLKLDAEGNVLGIDPLNIATSTALPPADKEKLIKGTKVKEKKGDQEVEVVRGAMWPWAQNKPELQVITLNKYDNHTRNPNCEAFATTVSPHPRGDSSEDKKCYVKMNAGELTEFKKVINEPLNMAVLLGANLTGSQETIHRFQKARMKARRNAPDYARRYEGKKDFDEMEKKIDALYAARVAGDITPLDYKKKVGDLVFDGVPREHVMNAASAIATTDALVAERAKQAFNRYGGHGGTLAFMASVTDYARRALRCDEPKEFSQVGFELQEEDSQLLFREKENQAEHEYEMKEIKRRREEIHKELKEQTKGEGKKK